MCLLKKISLFVFFSTFIFSTIQAKNISQEDKKNDDSFSWQATGSIATVYYDDILKHGGDATALTNALSLSVFFDLYYKGFFIQSNQRRSDGPLGNIEFGYQLYDENDWSLEVISKTYLSGFIIKDEIKYSKVEKENNILRGLKDRNNAQGFGARYSKFIEEDILSFDLAYLVSLNSGNHLVAKLYYSYFIPYRNWSIFANTGLTYYHKDTVNYYVGINNNEVLAEREYYQANSDAFEIELDILGLYPLSEKWTFNVGAKQVYYSSAVYKSPIVKSSGETLISLGVMYAF